MTTLRDLIGTVFTNYDERPRPLKPYKTGFSSAPNILMHSFRFKYDDYDGQLDLGWKSPWQKTGQFGNVIARYGWSTYIWWGLNRRLTDRGLFETHDETQDMIKIFDDGLIAQIDQSLNPALALTSFNHVYRLDLALVESFERYLEGYFARPQTVARFATFARIAAEEE